jgi:hypothetical protein
VSSRSRETAMSSGTAIGDQEWPAPTTRMVWRRAAAEQTRSATARSVVGSSHRVGCERSLRFQLRNSPRQFRGGRRGCGDGTRGLYLSALGDGAYSGGGE